jgi:hypothetical protein
MTTSHSSPFIARKVRALMSANPDITNIDIVINVWEMHGLKLTVHQRNRLREVPDFGSVSRAITRERARRAKLNGLG